jgi:XTP/dITP diphosphohydrolase
MTTAPSAALPHRLLVATNNRHKLHEIRDILAPHGIAVLGLSDVGLRIDVVEDAPTFEGNAALIAYVQKMAGLFHNIQQN